MPTTRPAAVMAAGPSLVLDTRPDGNNGNNGKADAITASTSNITSTGCPGTSGPGGPPAPPTLFHVAAVDQGLHLEPETLSHWGYDDGTSTLLVAKGGLVFAYDMSPGLAPGSPEQLRWTFPLPEGPTVVRMRLSLDGALLAIQRSGVLIEFVELASGNVFVQGTDRGRGEILSFFFTELAGSEVVLVTPSGLELLEFVARRQGLRMRERVRMPIEWALYTHETRMVLLGTSAGGTGTAPSYIKAFQFVSSGLVALPPFTAGAAGAALALMGSSGGAAAAALAGSPVAAAAVATPPVRVTADNLRLVKVYGRVYCAHINRRSLRLELYRFYTDTVVLQHTYELFSPAVELAVVDNVIVAHYYGSATAAAGGAGAGASSNTTAGSSTGGGNGAGPASRGNAGGSGGAGAGAPQGSEALGVAMLFDVAAPTTQPITNPLPLRILRHGPAAVAAAAAVTGREPSAPAPAADAGVSSTTAAGPAPPVSSSSSPSPSPSWEYLAPNVVLDRTGQTAYRLALNLAAVAESCSDPAIAVGFLQRRRGPTTAVVTPVPAAPTSAAAGAEAEGAAGAGAGSPKALLLSVVRNALAERMPMPTVRAIFEDLCAGYAAALDRELAVLAAGVAGTGGAAAAAPPAAAAAGTAAGAAAEVAAPPPPPLPSSVMIPQYVTAEELASELFRWLYDEEVVDAPYLQAALYEYMSAAAAAGIPLPPYLQELSVELLLQQSQANQVLQLLYGQQHQGHHPHQHPSPLGPTDGGLDPHLLNRLLTPHTTASNQAAASRDAAAVGEGATGPGAAAATTATTTDLAEGPLRRQVTVDALARAALVDRYEPCTTAHHQHHHHHILSYGGAALSRSPYGGGAGNAGGNSASGGDAAAYVEALLCQGEVLRAARVMRRYRVSRPSVKEFLAAVGARGDEALLAAVYRTFQDELLACYPKYDLAARKLLPPPLPAAAGAPSRAPAAVLVPVQ